MFDVLTRITQAGEIRARFKRSFVAMLDENFILKKFHPGSGRRKALIFSKGWQLNPEARQEIRSLLKTAKRARDLLIEYLHLIKDKYGRLSAAQIRRTVSRTPDRNI